MFPDSCFLSAAEPLQAELSCCWIYQQLNRLCLTVRAGNPVWVTWIWFLSHKGWLQDCRVEELTCLQSAPNVLCQQPPPPTFWLQGKEGNGLNWVSGISKMDLSTFLVLKPFDLITFPFGKSKSVSRTMSEWGRFPETRSSKKVFLTSIYQPGALSIIHLWRDLGSSKHNHVSVGNFCLLLIYYSLVQ